MAKKRDILLTVLFCGFIGTMAALTAFLPKQEVSVNEKRTLAKFPEFSVQKLFNGKWEKDFETYISDHFPARNFFASTDSYYMLYSGRNGSNGVYKGKDGYIINTPVKCDEEKLNANITAINNFVKNTGIETKIIVVPSTGYIMSEELPKVHTEYNDGEIIDDIKNRAENAEFIDIRDTLTENKDKQIYYKTDHHWTSYGAYLAYKKWAESENIEVHFKRKPAEILEEDNKVKGLVLENSETGEKEELMINGIFPFIGLDPMTQCAKSLGIVNAEGYIDANENMETAVKGVFVAGDVRSKQLRQVVTATNDGAIAGQYIASLK